VLTMLLDGFVHLAEYVQKHKDIIVGIFIGIATVVTAVYLPAMVEAIVATYLWLAPFLLIGIAIAAVIGVIALLYDDLKNFFEGHNSLIGVAVKKWPELGKVIWGIAAIVKALGPLFVSIWDALNERPQKAIATLEAAFKKFFQTLADYFKMPWLATAANAFVDFSDHSVRIIGDMVKAILKVVAALIKFFADLWNDPLNAVSNFDKSFYKIIDELVKDVTKLIKELVAEFPSLSSAFEAVGKVFQSVGNTIEGILHGILSTVEAVKNSPLKLLGLGGGTPQKSFDAPPGTGNGPTRHGRYSLPSAPASPGNAPSSGGGLSGWWGRHAPVALGGNAADIESGKHHLAATNASFNTLAPGTIAAGHTITNNNTVNATTTVNTAATDPKAVADAVDSKLNDHFNQVKNHYNDAQAV